MFGWLVQKWRVRVAVSRPRSARLGHTRAARVGGGRYGRCVAAVLVLVPVLAACAGAKDAPEPVTLRVLMTDDWARTGTVLDAVRDFEASRPGVRVHVEGVPVREMTPMVKARIAAGTPPDVAQGHAFAAAAQGIAQPLGDLWEKRLRAREFLSGAVEDVTWGGRRYGVPLDTNAMVLLYNKEHFAPATVAPPPDWSTFRDMQQAAAALTASDGSRRGVAFPFNTWQVYGWIRANGGEVIEVAENGEARVTLDAPQVVEAVDFLAGLVRSGHAFASLRNDVFTDADALFRSGSASVLPSGSWAFPALEAAGIDRYGSALLPGGTTGTTRGSALGGSSLYVPKGSKHRSLAFAFMLHLTADRYALRAAKEEGRLPARRRVFGDPYFDRPELRVVLQELEVAAPFKLVALPKVSSLFSQAVDDALRGRKGAGEALQEAQRRAQLDLDAAPPEPAD
jgi:multiple sugar transport system substrate-binding protein